MTRTSLAEQKLEPTGEMIELQEQVEKLRAELEERIEGARGPVGPLNKFQIEEVIDPRDTRKMVCDWVTLAYKVIAHPDRLLTRNLRFRP